jgi:hypothetical protein
MGTEAAVPACAVCEMRVNGPDGSVVYADELWTVTLGADVPGWFMVIANRHRDEWLWGRGPHLLSHAAELADGDEALRVGERVRSRLA